MNSSACSPSTISKATALGFAALLIACGGAGGNSSRARSTDLTDTKIAFVSRRAGGTPQIFTMKPDGSDVKQLTTGANGSTSPQWTPDLSQIVFVSTKDGNSDLFIMNADGTNQRRLTNDADLEERPTVSPDGSTVIFDTNRDGQYEIYSVRLSDLRLTRITKNAVDDQHPFWKPDGMQIGCVRSGNLWVMNPDGSFPIPLLPTQSVGTDPNPSWSPDGSLIAFDYQGGSTGNLYLVKVDGSGVKPLTVGSFVGSVTWSPNGAKLIFNSRTSPGSTSDIFTVSADGSNLSQVTTSSGDGESPAWSPFPFL